MSRDVEYDTEERDAGVALRRSRRDQDGSGASALLDRLEKALHGTEEALSTLTERLSPVLTPEPPSSIDGVAMEEPRSELAARLDRMCAQAERHRAYARALAERVDL
jgi:predicted Zn-dependent protease